MSVRRNKDGQRSVEAAVEVPGSPEEVWQAIATGTGISSWFVPTSVDEREGGETVSSFGPGMDAVTKITEWNPPHSYTAETEESAEEPIRVATEWIVEARSGGTCTVRVVHRWFAETDDWDAEFESHAYGWASTYFRMLRLYLTSFYGEVCSAFALSSFSTSQPAETWRAVKNALAIDRSGQRVESTSGGPEISGVVVSTEVTDPELLRIRDRSPLIRATMEGMNGENPELLLRLDRPAPGFAHLFIMAMGEQTLVSIRFYLFGDKGAEVSAISERQWSDWLGKQFPEGNV